MALERVLGALGLLAALSACSGRSIVGAYPTPDVPHTDAAEVALDDLADDLSDDTSDVPDVMELPDAGDAGNAGDVSDADDAPIDAGPTRCATDEDCASAPEGALCDPATGSCARCLPSRDTCPAGRRCDPDALACLAGCRADEADGGTCVTGVCAAGRGDCDDADGCETDLRTHPAHCGACGTRCPSPPNADPTCFASACGFTCRTGFADCDGAAANGCEVDLRSSLAHCGRCGSACAAGSNAVAACADGACAVGACSTGFADCDNAAANGCEVDTRINTAHCGRCATACPAGRACADGRCGPPCPTEQSRCGLACSDGQTDNANCGACGVACRPNEACARGVCALRCPLGRSACGGACVDTARDPDHCGACGRACPSGCFNGRCAAVQDVDLARNNSCLLYTSGRVFCWGLRAGMLPHASASSARHATPQVVTDSLRRPLEGVRQIALAQDRACALGRDGAVRCWGAGYLPGSVAGLANVTQVHARDAANFLAVTGSGAVFTWDGVPRAASAPAAVVAGVTSAAEVAGGVGFGCARRTDSTVVCWGAGTSGQLGNRASATSAAPVTVTGLTDAVQITAGFSHACALRRAGTVACWGLNASGQLGDGSTTNRDVPTPVTGLAGVTQVRAGAHHTCAVLADGSVRCWGLDAQAQCGDGATEMSRTTPVAVAGLPPSRAVAAYEHHTCAVGRDDQVRCWGYNPWGEAGGGTEARPSPAAVRELTGVVDLRGHITSGDARDSTYFKCALLSDGAVRCWSTAADAAARQGALGDGASAASTAPVAVSGLTDATQITLGGAFACALKRDGTVVCWGANGAGQLGDGTTNDRSTPVLVRAATGALDGVVEVHAGARHTCARRADGDVWCWGSNRHGALGDGTTNDRSTAAAVAGLTGSTQLAVGAGFACVRAGDAMGRAQCWGRNAEFQLADGGSLDRARPGYVTSPTSTAAAPVSQTGIAALRCELSGCYARLTDGSARRWGFGSPALARVSQDPAGVINLLAQATQGFGVTCQLRADTNLYCAGANEFGQVGVGRTSVSEPYTMVPGTFSALQGGAAPGVPCAIERVTGRVLCWGPTRDDQLLNAGVDGLTRAPAVIAPP